MITKRNFIKKSILGTVGGFIAPNLLAKFAGQGQTRGSDLDVYTKLAEIAPLGVIYSKPLVKWNNKDLEQYFSWWIDTMDGEGRMFWRGWFRYSLVDTIEKKIYYWKGLLEFYKNNAVPNPLDKIPLDYWLTEIFLDYKIPLKDSFIFLGYPVGDKYPTNGNTYPRYFYKYSKYEINPNLVKFIENYK